MISLLSFLLITLGIVVVTMVRVWPENRSNAATFFLAGRSLPWFVISGSLLLTNLSTEQLVGLNGAAYRQGMPVIAWEVFGALGLLVFANFFLPRYWGARVTTIPEFIERRYDADTRRLAAALTLLTLVLNAMPFVLYSGAVALVGMLDLPQLWHCSYEQALQLTVVAIGVLGGAYALGGGLKAVALLETMNGVGFIAGGCLILVLALRRLGHGELSAGFAQLPVAQRAQLNPFGGMDSALPWPTLLTGMVVLNLSSWCTNHNNIQRALGARSLVESQRGALAAALLKLLGPLYLVLPGIVAARLLRSAPITSDLVYPQLVALLLPPSLSGAFGAVVFSVVVGAFSSAVFSASTIFGVDFYRAAWRPGASDGSTVRAGRLFGLAAVAAVTVLAPFSGTSAGGFFGLMKQINAAFAVPILAVVLLGLLPIRVTGPAARTGMLAGFIGYVLLNVVRARSHAPASVHWLHGVGAYFLSVCLITWGLSRKDSRANDAAAATGSGDRSWSLIGVATGSIAALAVALYGGLWLLSRP